MPVSHETLEEIALTEAEYEAIVERLGRVPNSVELGMFGALWSEHCGYKHSKWLLGLFPTESPRLLTRSGQENAGAVDIGHGRAAVFKIESHNHPSAVEPFQGAATGVGGIVRDILALGARPIALLNSLRFGPLSDPRSRYLFQGVVGGISAYGNCIGVPDVGGEVQFSPAYASNPLVNALCVGIVPAGKLVRSAAGTPGNLLVLVGAETGRDGIHGASGLASRTFEEQREQRPAVQMGNPFLEKVLIEACLEVAEADLVEGMQDLGAAGLTSSVVESAARGGTGFVLDISRVPRREEGMTPYDVMLSESQERMLLIVPPDNLQPVRGIYEKWDIPCTVIGNVIDDGVGRVVDGERLVATLPLSVLTDPPLYDVRAPCPPALAHLQAYNLASLPPPGEGAGAILLRLLASPTIASKESVFRQYDHQVQTNTVIGPGADAALLRLKGTPGALALATDGNGRMCYLDPSVGGAMAVAEACRNVVCVGGTPVALTDCLNFGDPDRPDVAYQMEQCVKGMASACAALAVPVISGNVSLYNETGGQPVYPTPVVGALGLLEDVGRRCGATFQQEGDGVVLLGAASVAGEVSTLAGSEYLELVHGLVAGRPAIDLELEARVQRCCLRLIQAGLLHSAHDCSDGGLAVALAESAIQGGLGFVSGAFHVEGRWDVALYGEAPSRIVVSFPSSALVDVERTCREEGVPFAELGAVGGQRFRLSGLMDLSLDAIADVWERGLERALDG